jgi:TolB protein
MRGKFLAGVAAGLVIVCGEAAGQAARQPPVHGGAPAVSPDGSKIAFLSDRDGADDIFLIGADGTGEVRLTKTPETESQPEWSADGSRLFFSVFADGASRIYSIGLDDRSTKLIGTVPGRAIRVSRDGKHVLYWTGSWTAMKLFESGVDGSAARQLTDGKGVVWGARWSPDGKRIAFGGKDSDGVVHVYAIDADGSGRERLTRIEPSGMGEQMPAWSPDGSTLAVQAGMSNQPAHIWLVDLKTGAGRKLGAHTEAYNDEVPAWFPDGRRIAFQSDRTGVVEVWAMGADGSDQRQVTLSSPSGKR